MGVVSLVHFVNFLNLDCKWVWLKAISVDMVQVSIEAHPSQEAHETYQVWGQGGVVDYPGEESMWYQEAKNTLPSKAWL